MRINKLDKLEKQIECLHRKTGNYDYISFIVTGGEVTQIEYKKFPKDEVKTAYKGDKIFEELLHPIDIKDGLYLSYEGNITVFDEGGI